MTSMRNIHIKKWSKSKQSGNKNRYLLTETQKVAICEKKLDSIFDLLFAITNPDNFAATLDETVFLKL